MVLGLCSCGGNDAVEQPRDSVAEEAPEETVFDPLVGTLDKAHGVEELAGSRKGDLDRQLEAAE